MSTAVVVDSMDPDEFNNDQAAQSATRASIVSSVPSINSDEQVTNLRASNYVGRRTGLQAQVSFDLVVSPTAGQDATELRSGLVTELTAAVQSNTLTDALIANAPSNSSLANVTVDGAASSALIEVVTIVTTEAPTTSTPSTSTPSTSAPTTSAPTSNVQTSTPPPTVPPSVVLTAGQPTSAPTTSLTILPTSITASANTVATTIELHGLRAFGVDLHALFEETWKSILNVEAVEVIHFSIHSSRRISNVAVRFQALAPTASAAQGMLSLLSTSEGFKGRFNTALQAHPDPDIASQQVVSVVVTELPIRLGSNPAQSETNQASGGSSTMVIIIACSCGAVMMLLAGCLVVWLCKRSTTSEQPQTDRADKSPVQAPGVLPQKPIDAELQPVAELTFDEVLESEDIILAHHELQHVWQQLTDGNDRLYYYNIETQETQWDQPAEGFDPIEPVAPVAHRELQSTFATTHTGDGDVDIRGKVEMSTSDHGLQHVWQQLADSNGRLYYYNIETQTTQWDQPAEGFDPIESN